MIRNLKALGLALVAVFAFSAVAAAGAQATAADFELGSGTGYIEIEGEGPQDFTVPGLPTVRCDEFFATAPVNNAGPQSELTVTDIEYLDNTIPNESTDHCELKETGLTAEVNFPSECHYRLHNGVTLAPGEATSTVDIQDTVGGANCEIEITAPATGDPLCTITVNPQNGLEHIVYEQKETEGIEDITAEATVEGIHAEFEGLLCEGTSEEAVYEGNFTATGFDTEDKPTDLTIVDT